MAYILAPMDTKNPTQEKTFDQTCKEFGFKRARVVEITGIGGRTLNNWFNERPKLMSAILVGCFVLNELEKNTAKFEEFVKTIKNLKPKKD